MHAHPTAAASIRVDRQSLVPQYLNVSSKCAHTHAEFPGKVSDYQRIVRFQPGSNQFQTLKPA
jgi:hypothetical protein